MSTTTKYGEIVNITSKTAIATITIASLSLLVEEPFTDILKSFWFGLGTFIQARWDQILNKIGDDPFIHWAILPSTVIGITYFTLGTLYTIMDVTGKPSFIKKYKIQEGTNEPLDIKKLPKMYMINFFNLGIQVYLAIFAFYPVMKWRGLQNIREIPTFHRMVIDFIIHTFIQEMGVYYAHRMFHSKLFYKKFHKLHHEWTSPVAMSTFYVHPVEHIISNIIPPFSSFVLCRTHIITALLWVSSGIVVALHTHSGYHFPFMPSPESHDFHHLIFNECYGPLGLFDRIHGTDKKFRASAGYPRDFITTTLTPPKELFPNKKKSIHN